jgi:hypothetical protein
MAKSDDPTANDGWTVVSEEMPERFTFETPGEEFIGKYVRTEIAGQGEGRFDVYVFEVDGVRTSITSTSRLRTPMRKVRPGMMVRIVYIGDVETNQDNPMKDFEVSFKR